MNEIQTQEEEAEKEKAWDEGLKGSHRLFLLELVTNEDHFLDPKEAYKQAFRKKDRQTKNWKYPTDAAASVSASKLMKKPKIRQALRLLLQSVRPELDEENIEKALHEVAVLAFFNPAEILTDDGSLVKPLKELGDKARCIAQIRNTKYGTEYVLADRSKYLEILCRYLNIVRPEQQKEIQLQVVEVAAKITGNGIKDAVDAWNDYAQQEEQ